MKTIILKAVWLVYLIVFHLISNAQSVDQPIQMYKKTLQEKQTESNEFIDLLKKEFKYLKFSPADDKELIKKSWTKYESEDAYTITLVDFDIAEINNLEDIETQLKEKFNNISTIK
ncbi:hypothetical protein JYT59_00960 [Sphingobacteriaceae bacterium AH-315-L07]|nr:hypothetical protein [Sphingobacteriaceae bacterium AH-315-L07]